MMDVLPLLAEFLGVVLLVVSILIANNAIVIGATLALIVFLIGGVSGAHVNPAVSLGMWMKGSLSVVELASYIAVQMVGGATAAYLYKTFV